MARIRTIKPEFWKHEGLCEQPEATHMLAAALLNYADDYGYFNANPKLIAGEIYPLREPSVSIPESLQRLQAIGYIQLGTGTDGRRYGFIVEFDTHQRVSHPTDSKISCLSITWDISGNTPEKFENPPETFVPEQGTGKGKEQGKEHEAPRAKRAVVSLPDWIPQEPWKAYVEMRKKIKSPLTDRALELEIKKLEALKVQGFDPGAILDQSTMKTWRGLFPLKADNIVPPSSAGPDPSLAAAQRLEREAINKTLANAEGSA